jgi:hypothetical protein
MNEVERLKAEENERFVDFLKACQALIDIDKDLWDSQAKLSKFGIPEGHPFERQAVLGAAKAVLDRAKYQRITHNSGPWSHAIDGSAEHTPKPEKKPSGRTFGLKK